MVCLNDCSGHGICVNGTCICNEFWSGKSDILTFDGYDCQTPTIGEKIVFGLIAFSGIRLFMFHLKAIKLQHGKYLEQKERAAKKGKKLAWYEFMPYQILIPGLFFGPMFVYLAIPKIFEFERNELGVDWGISLTLSVLVPSGFCTNILTELKSFDALAKGVGSGSDKVERIRRFMSVGYWSSLTLYGLATFATMIYGCLLGVQDPRTSIMRYMLIFRNISVVIFLMTLFLINKEVRKKAKSLFTSTVDQASSKSTRRLEKFLAFIDESSTQKRKVAIAGTIVYCIGCLPWLWPYQGFVIGFLTFNTAMSKGQPVHTFTTTSDSSEKTTAGQVAPTSSTTSSQSSMQDP